MGEILLAKECYELIGLCMEVHRILGPGFSEVIYKDALELELKNHDIPYSREKLYKVEYKGSFLPSKYKADFVVYDSIILEAKAVSSLLIISRRPGSNSESSQILEKDPSGTKE